MDVGYYVRMGGGAYCTLSGTIRGTLRGRVMGEVFAELGAKFTETVDVLNEVRDRPAAATWKMPWLYENSVRTGIRARRGCCGRHRAAGFGPDGLRT